MKKMAKSYAITVLGIGALISSTLLTGNAMADKPKPPNPNPPLVQTPHAVSNPNPINGISPAEATEGLALLQDPTAQAMIALMPALLASMNERGDGTADPALLEQARSMLKDQGAPKPVEQMGDKILNFMYKDNPDKNFKPTDIQQFLMPTVGKGCMNTGNSIGLALAAPGPRKDPAPGVEKGQTAFVFTSMGTGPAVFSGTDPLTIQWSNLDTKKSGRETLKPNPLINAAKGPATFTTVANTGEGRIIATISGTVVTKNLATDKDITCKISPTVGLIRNQPD